MKGKEMRVTVISGFLGAGKTTLVRQMLSQSVAGTAVLVNDFGETGVDGELLQGEDIDIVEMPSGCICCTLKNDLIRGLNELYEKASPEKLIIEPSGLADLSALLEALELPAIKFPLMLEAVITVVEPEMFLTDLKEENFGDFYYDQIGNADLVLLNKCDLSEAGDVELAIKELQKINQDALVLKAVRCEVVIPELTTKDREHEHKQNHDHDHDHDHDHEEEHGHTKLSSLALRRQGFFKKASIEELLQQVVRGDFGRIYRAKGFFKGSDGDYYYDLVRSRWEITPWDKPLKESRFVFIGDDLGNLAEALDKQESPS